VHAAQKLRLDQLVFQQQSKAINKDELMEMISREDHQYKRRLDDQ